MNLWVWMFALAGWLFAFWNLRLVREAVDLCERIRDRRDHYANELTNFQYEHQDCDVTKAKRGTPMTTTPNETDTKPEEGRPDWTRACFVCGMRPVVYFDDDPDPLCGPCTFGEAETIGGNW